MKTPYRVLIVEDVPADAELNERAIRQVLGPCVFERVETEAIFLKALDTFNPDIVISDYKMPTFDGMTALKLTLERTPLTPFILVTGSMNEDTAVDCMKAGASNYVIKQHLKRLGPAVLHALEEKKIRIERLKVQDALIESEDKYRTLVEHAGEAISVAQDGMLKFANARSEDISGYSRQELMSRPFIDFVHPDDRALVLERHAKRFEDVEVLSRYIFRIVHRSGDTRWVELNAVMISWEGKPATLNFLSDITQRKRAEEELRFSEERYRSVVENIGIGISLISPSMEILALNKQMKTWFPHIDVSSRPICYKSFNDPPREEICSYCPTCITLQDGQVHEAMTETPAKDKVIFFRVISSPVKDQDGKIIAAIEMVEDITERKRTEAALQENEAFIKAVLDNLPVGVAVNSVDPTVTFNYMNDNFPRFYRTTREKLSDPDAFWSVVYEDPEFREKIKKRVLDDCASGNPESMNWADIPITRKGEETSFISAGNIPVPDKPLMISTVWDVTERKRGEEEMKKLSTAVEHSADWILITDREGTIEYVNKAVENISGYTKEELIGKNPGIFKSGRHDQKFYEKLWAGIIAGNTFSGIVINRKKTGELFELHYTITPLKDEEGKVHHFVGTAKDITEKKLLEERLDYMAYYDSLTGLPNKRLFADRLSQSLISAEQQGMHVAVLFVDIDRFTSLNETYGYEMGDEILKEAGRRLSYNICRDCTVGRIDADKFGVILVDMQHSEDVILALEKMQSAFKKPIRVDLEDIIITLSAGIALFPGDGKEPGVLMQNADIALAKAKAGGINMYQFFTAEMNKKATEFIHMQRHLFNALERNEFIMHYQPYFDSVTREMVGMEALIRWNSREFGLVSPGLFIPILEETGMIIDVGKWIIRTVCRQIKEWMDRGYKSSIVPVYVNLSLAQFAQRDLSDFIEKTIGETGIYPSFLGFEITESIFMQDIEHTQAVLENLRQKGISVNIDDFGTGYSSLSNLKRLPVSSLKIDISFIRDVTTNPDDASIVITIISMAHNLSLKTIAEGVETEEQWKILRILKCDMAQGHYFSKPLPAEEVERFFKQL